MDQGVESEEKRHKEERRGKQRRVEKRWEEHTGSSFRELNVLLLYKNNLCSFDLSQICILDFLFQRSAMNLKLKNLLGSEL